METLRILVRVRPEDIAYLRATLESYDGMAVVSTVDPIRAVIELRVSPGCRRVALEILEDLQRTEGLDLEPLIAPTAQTEAESTSDSPPGETNQGLFHPGGY
jgi:hypothetical protein